MVILDTIVQNISGVAIGMGTAFLMGKMLPGIKKSIVNTILNFKKDINAYIKNKVKDPDIRNLVIQGILVVQKKFKGVNGKAKFNAVRKLVLDKCPDILAKMILFL